MSASLIAKNATGTSNDVESVLTVASYETLEFVNGRISLETTFAGITSTSFWHVQSAEFSIANNLKADSESRRIGSDQLAVLPPGVANLSLSMTVRYDTTTAFDAMVAGTQYAAQLHFEGSTLGTSVIKRSLRLNFPKIFFDDAGEPEIDGPDGIYTKDITFQVLRDDSSAAGYACQAEVTNVISSFS